MSVDMHQIVTERILGELDRGIVPWHRPWDPAVGQPRSIDGKPYRGINTILLGLSEYSDPRWGTYKALQSHGGQVREGEHGEQIVLWKQARSKPDDEGERHGYMLLRYFRVFNVEQCDGIAALEMPAVQAAGDGDTILAGYPDPPEVRYGGAQAFYRPSADRVQMPLSKSFDTPASHYTTLYHELVHSTGAAKRLNRPEVVERNGFGSLPYSREELVAEIGACMLAASVGIEPDYSQSASYIHGWRTAINENRKLIINAAGRAQKAVDHICGNTPRVSAST
jgi:antirestriction protein ArdC